MGVKYGIVITLTEELLGVMFSKDLLLEPNKGLAEAVKAISLANLKVPVDEWRCVECEMTKNCLNDTYVFRLRSLKNIEGLYEIKTEGLEYPKRNFKNEKDW